MKQIPEFSEAQANMRAGVISAEGFLGNDTRPLTDIIEADIEALAKLGLSSEKIAERMRYFMNAGKSGLGEAITVDKKWVVRVDETRGHLPSPFGGDGIYRKVNVEIERIDHSNEKQNRIVYNELIIHLIEKYSFFQGKGSRFRIEPANAQYVLGLDF